MYKLPYFTEPNEDEVLKFMKKNPFAIITGGHQNFPVATHVPLAIKKHEGKIILTGHMMTGTDHHLAFLENENVLVIFTGPDCYVSASWYVTKNVASTWNYIDIQARGKIKFTDEQGTREIIKQITNQYESPESEAAFDKLPEEYISSSLKFIIGFNIEVESLENVFKLSQNQDITTRQQIIENLRKLNDHDSSKISMEMEKRL